MKGFQFGRGEDRDEVARISDELVAETQLFTKPDYALRLGDVSWVGRVSIEWAGGDKVRSPLSPPSLSTGGDQRGGLAVFSVSAQLAHGRGDVGGARYRPELRNGETLCREICTELRQPASSSRDPFPATRGILTFLFRSGATPNRKAPDAQAVEEICNDPARSDHGQATLLRRGETGTTVWRRASTKQGSQ